MLIHTANMFTFILLKFIHVIYTVDPWLSSPYLSGTLELEMTVLLEYFKYKCAF